MRKPIEGLTKKEEEFLNDLIEFTNTKGYTPTVRELGDYVGLRSPATVNYHLDMLVKKGFIKRINNRSIEVLRCK